MLFCHYHTDSFYWIGARRDSDGMFKWFHEDGETSSIVVSTQLLRHHPDTISSSGGLTHSDINTSLPLRTKLMSAEQC